MISRSMILMAVLFAFFASAPVIAQQIIYPANGQSAEQQQKDKPSVTNGRKGRQAMIRHNPPNMPWHQRNKALVVSD